jgi:hypothetical protein
MRDNVLKIESLIKIRVQEILNNDGWERRNYFGIKELKLSPVPNNDKLYIELIHDGICFRKWRVAEQTVPQLPVIALKPDEDHPEDEPPRIKRRSPMLAFFVIGANGRKHRYLYFWLLPHQQQFLIGTRSELNARYASSCMSRKQRQQNPNRRKPID